MTVVPVDFDYTDAKFVEWRATLPEEHQALMRKFDITEQGALSTRQLQRQDLLWSEWFRAHPLKNQPKEQHESDEERRLRLVLDVQDRLILKTIRDTQEIVWYDEELGCYRDKPSGDVLIKELLQELHGSSITEVDRRETIAAVRADTGVDREKFDADVHVFNLRNGLLNIETGEFREHTSEYLSLVQLPVTYDPKATCPTFARFLREVLEPEHIGMVVKLMAYLLLKQAIYHKAFLFVGEGSNGKSTLIETVKALLGAVNVANKSLQDITNNRFAKANLHGKMANLFADIPDEKLLNTGDFKMLVSGDTMSAEFKFGQPFTFQNYAKMVFSANQIPKTDDKSYAYYRRWVIIPFNRTFEGDEADEDLLAKLTTPGELSGILNLTLKGLKKLRTERGFKEMDLEDIKRQYELGASRIRSFLDEQCILEPGNDSLYVEASILKDAFRTYCREHGTRYYDENKLGQQLAALEVKNRQKRIGKNRPHCYFGICLRSSRLNVSGKMSTLREDSEGSTVLGGEVRGDLPEPASRQGGTISSKIIVHEESPVYLYSATKVSDSQ